MAVRRTALAAPALGTDALPEEGTGRLILIVARQMRTRFDQRVSRLGLTMQQAGLLVWAHRFGGTTPGALTDFLGTDEAGVSRLLDRLEAKGLLVRRSHERDGRSLKIVLTPSGRAMVPRLERLGKAARRRVFTGLREEEQRALHRTLRRIHANLAEDWA
jgi:DNA-binding MarR family transcriptional regulator